MSRSNGHCMTMGTASTMACVSEALGMQLPGSAAIPAVDARRYRIAQLAGRRIVAMVGEDLRMSRVLTREAFQNAIRVNAAIGGSTNAIVHLLALAGRVGVELDLDDFDRLARDVPVLVDLKPSGDYLMEDFYYAGGLPAVIRELGDLIDGGALTVNGHTLGANVADAPCYNRTVIRPRFEPLLAQGATAVLRGNLCPDGAVLKQSAASPHLLRHRGPALVFDTIEEFEDSIDKPDLEVDEHTVLVVRGAGPRGYPGMPEIGNLALPRKLLERGVTDMVRISDARMSGTSYGTVVLHVCPESAVGGPLALARSGDMIVLDVPARRLDLDVGQAELDDRRQAWSAPPPVAERGYARLYTDHVLQASRGADLDFLTGSSGAQIPRRPF
jgi:L-arabonate dehydrase